MKSSLRRHASDQNAFLMQITRGVMVLMAALVIVSCTDLKSGSESATQGEGELPASSGQEIQQWASPPALTIDPVSIYLATFKTERGDIKVQLFAAQAPNTVNNFVFLAQEGFYDNTTFHRVIPGFMAQGGDPTGTGTGGPGYRFEDEFDPGLRFDEGGYLAMANAGPDTNGSQFFLTFVATPHLNDQHTIFGKVVEGMDVLLSLSPRDPTQNPEKLGDRLLSVQIEQSPESLLPTPALAP